MSDAFPEMDREQRMRELIAEAEGTLQEVADAVDEAPAGHSRQRRKGAR